MYFCKLCDLSFDTVETKAMMLKCGHSFCHKCISNCISQQGEFGCANCFYVTRDISETTANLVFYDKSCYRNQLTPLKTKSKLDHSSNGKGSINRQFSKDRQERFLIENNAQEFQRSLVFDRQEKIENQRPLKKCQGYDCNKLTLDTFCSSICFKSSKFSRTEERSTRQTIQQDHVFGVTSQIMSSKQVRPPSKDLFIKQNAQTVG